MDLERSQNEDLVEEIRLNVPTFNGNFFPTEVEGGEKPEFGDPTVPVLIHKSAGVRVVLGTHNYSDPDKPDIHIERQPNAWAIFLHPLGEGDPCGYLYFLDDGRSFLIKAYEWGTTPAIQVLECGESIPEVHRREK